MARLIYLDAETNIHTSKFYLYTFTVELTPHLGFLVADYSTYFSSSKHIIKDPEFPADLQCI